MILTDETTIEEYAAWLATNPSFESFKKAVRSSFNMIFKVFGRIRLTIKRIKNKSCTSGLRVGYTIYPLAYNKNAGYNDAAFKKWLRHIRFELSMTTDYLKALEMAEYLDYEIAMEGLKIEVLELLKTNI